ncbi:MAG: hypothetical protein ACXWA3_11110 [Acidimicrobiales bacterium]
MRHRYRVSAVLVVCAMAALGVSATTAAAAPPPAVACGQTITTSVVLRADLACTGDGLVIAASDVTVQLAGHTISSNDGTGVGIRFGVAPTTTTPPVCVGDVVVRGGTISGFSKGLAGGFCDATDDRVSGMDLEGNTWGVYLQSGLTLDIDHTTIVGPNGIGGPYSPGAATGGVTLSHSRIQVTDANGFSLFAAFTPSTIDSSRLDGGFVYGVVNGSLSISNSRLTGVSVACSDANVAITNTYIIGGGVERGSVCGYYLADDHFIGPGSGVAADLGAYSYLSTVTDSVFTGWDIAVSLGPGPATITGNTFRQNGTGVASCTTSNCGGTISGNSFVANLGDGLLLTSGTWHVGSNVAVRNGGLGIDAQGPGLTVIDDGGNLARRNQPPQCVGVVCAVHP